MFSFMKNKLIWVAITFTFIAWNSGCSNDDGGETEHAEVRGLILRMADSVLVAVDSTIVTGQLTFPSDNLYSDSIKVWFISDDENRDEFRPDNVDEALHVTVTDTGVATVLFHAGGTDPDARWGFQVKGKSAGATTLKVQILHIDHPDYTSPLIPLVIE